MDCFGKVTTSKSMLDYIIILVIIASLCLWRSFWFRNKYDSPKATKEQIFFKTLRIRVPINALFFISAKDNYAKKANLYLRYFYMIMGVSFLLTIIEIFTKQK